MPLPNDPLDAALAVASALDAAAIPYAIGGALAYGIWGIPGAAGLRSETLKIRRLNAKGLR